MFFEKRRGRLKITEENAEETIKLILEKEVFGDE